jgi:hypothetical protein
MRAIGPKLAPNLLIKYRWATSMRRDLVCGMLLMSACGDDGGIADGGVPCLTSHCSDPEPEQFACQNVLDASGRPAQADFLLDLDDPLARLILKRPGPCPSTYAELIDKFRLEDRVRCYGGDRAGMVARVVSERAQLLGQADSARVMVGRQCSRRAAYEVFFALPPIDTANPELPDGPIQVMAFDDSVDAFNFYTLGGTQDEPAWSWNGGSFDMIDGDPVTGGACERCHGDGGLAMGEIVEPWLHWESGATRTPGVDTLIDRYAELGSRGAGPELGEIVRAGNRRWNESRIAMMRDEAHVERHGGSLRPLLAPLFCPSTHNLGSAGRADHRGTPRPVDRFPTDFFVDPAWQLSTDVPFDPLTYQSSLLLAGSRIDGVAGPIDTFFGFTYPSRAVSDVDYVARLVEIGLVDEEFVLDVLSIDFTRPVFSHDRCELLEYVPDFVDLDSTEAPVEPTTGTSPRPCCEPHDGPGCEDPGVQLCVCTIDPFCCQSDWDQACINHALAECDGGCEGIVAAPGLTATRSTAAQPAAVLVRNAMWERLDDASPPAGSPAARLRDALATEDQTEQHRAAVERFLQACRDRAAVRDEVALVADVLEVAALRRAAALERSDLLTVPSVVVTDDLRPSPTAYLDPLTCELVTD